jgi:hypothetical protein
VQRNDLTPARDRPGLDAVPSSCPFGGAAGQVRPQCGS